MFNKSYIFIISLVLILIFITYSLTTLLNKKESFDMNTISKNNQNLRGYIDQKLEFLNNSGNSVYNEGKLRMDSTIYAYLLLTTIATLLLIGVLKMKI